MCTPQQWNAPRSYSLDFPSAPSVYSNQSPWLRLLSQERIPDPHKASVTEKENTFSGFGYGWQILWENIHFCSHTSISIRPGWLRSSTIIGQTIDWSATSNAHVAPPLLVVLSLRSSLFSWPINYTNANCK
jgi:hypothetical protein